jgi:hypothetical protein
MAMPAQIMISSAALLLSYIGSSVSSVAAEPSAAVQPLAPIGMRAALYKGRHINLSVSWEGAKVCAVLSWTNVRCYDSPADFAEANGLTQERALVDCPFGYYCLFEHVDYGGRMTYFRVRGCQNLSWISFNDRASSYYNLTSTTGLYEHDGCRNRMISSPYGHSHPNFLTLGINDKASSLSIF